MADQANVKKSPEQRNAERLERRRQNAAERRRNRAKQRERRRIQDGPVALPALEPVSQGSGRARVRQGTVVSDKADKTITVRIDAARRHRVYKKIIRDSSNLHAHDERNEANVGDVVRVVESRPLSRTKRWRLVEIVERGR